MEHSPKFTEQVAASMKTDNPLRESLGERRETCPEHGEFTSSGMRYLTKLQIWSKCPDCEEARLVAERRAEAEKKAAEAQARIEAMIDSAAIPKRFIGRSFDNFNAQTPKQEAARKIVQDYAENFAENYKRGAGLVLSGLPGTGKSHLATAALQAIMPKYAGLYITCMGVIRAIRGTWRKDAERSESEVLNILCDVPLLVLDEIGVQYGTDGEQTILFDVLDRRYRDMMPSILLTNQDSAGFKQFIGERSFDRLAETSRWVAFDWPSYRPTARKEAS